MMGSGMPSSHSRIPLPMLILSIPYSCNTRAQRFARCAGSSILLDGRFNGQVIAPLSPGGESGCEVGRRRKRRLRAIVRRLT
jgi:hypothetical protein